MVLGSLRSGLSSLLPAAKPENGSQSPSSPGTNICDRCTGIELDKILRNLSDKLKQAEATESHDPQPHIFQVHDLGPADTWSPVVCALCFLFEAVRAQSADIHQVYTDPSIQYDLKAIPLANLVSRDGKASYKHLIGNVNMALALCVNGHADLALSGALPLIAKSSKFWHFQDRVGTHALVLSPQFDARLACKWLHFCKRSHSKCRENVTHESDDFRPALLINCYSRRVVQPKQAEAYVALSYVWGSMATSNNMSGTAVTTAKAGALLPSNIPAVVEDAMHVAKSFGVVYLWVDRYCIDQSDEQQTAHEIKHMHRIFSRAILTIVAACGPGAESGLCGTRGTSRKASPVRAVVKGLSLHIMPPDPAKAVEKSAWETRGWTYQEMVLSNRRLFFTPTEVFYECRKWRYREAIDEPGGYLSDVTAWGRDLPSNSHTRQLGSLRDPPESWFYHIEMYSRRNLTYDADAFAAFRGILSFYESLDEPWYHVWGLILGGTEAAYKFQHRNPLVTVADCSPLKYLARSLMWSHIEEEAELVRSSRERIPELPSWSWVGWTGAKSLKLCRFSPRLEERCNKLQAASLELIDGSSKPVESINDARTITECALQWSNVLKLQAPLISIQCMKDEIRGLDEGKRWLSVQTVPEGRPVHVFVDVTIDPFSLFARTQSTYLHALVLGAGIYVDDESIEHGYEAWQLRVLVIEEFEPTLWARSGLMILYSNGWNEFNNISWNVKEIRMC